MRTAFRHTCPCSVCNGRDAAPSASVRTFVRRPAAVHRSLRAALSAELARNLTVSLPKFGGHPRVGIQLEYTFSP